MGTYRRIAWRNSLRLGEFRERSLAKIHLAQQGSVSRSHSFESPANTFASSFLKSGLWLSCRLKLLNPALKRRPLGGTPPIVIDDRIAQHAIEPRHGRLAFAQPIPGIKQAHVCRLQNILCNSTILDAPLNKPKELPAQQKQRIDSTLRHERNMRGGSVTLAAVGCPAWLDELAL